jgi:hypothetical protein
MMRIVTSHYRYKQTAKRRRKGAMISEPSPLSPRPGQPAPPLRPSLALGADLAEAALPGDRATDHVSQTRRGTTKDGSLSNPGQMSLRRLDAG